MDRKNAPQRSKHITEAPFSSMNDIDRIRQDACFIIPISEDKRFPVSEQRDDDGHGAGSAMVQWKRTRLDDGYG